MERHLERPLRAIRRRGGGVVLAAFGASLALLLATGCTRASAPVTSSVQQPAGAQTCAECNGKGSPPQVRADAQLENRVQVIRVGVTSGYYAPNTLKAKAGSAIRIVFSGSAKGCLAKPRFSSLGKKADFSGGEATLDLGTLAPGTYSFTCAMGKNSGSLVVR